MTLNGIEVVRSVLATRLPFADRDLVEFALEVPPGYQFERYLTRQMFIRYFPDYSKVPLADTGLPLISCTRDLRLRAKQIAQWHLNEMGLEWLRWPSRKPYKDYGSWFRTVLRSWVEDTLLNSKSSIGQYVDSELVRGLVSEHMSGVNHSVRLGALLTLELWHRRFLH
jgi:asparagine synthetase B (glutamine-hydrolysing)